MIMNSRFWFAKKIKNINGDFQVRLPGGQQAQQIYDAGLKFLRYHRILSLMSFRPAGYELGLNNSHNISPRFMTSNMGLAAFCLEVGLCCVAS